RIAELAQLIQQKRAELGSFVTRKETSQKDIEESRGRIGGLQHERDQVNNQKAELLAQKQTQDSEIDSREEGLREQRRVLSEIQEKRGALEVELAQKNMSEQNLRER